MFWVVSLKCLTYPYWAKVTIYYLTNLIIIPPRGSSDPNVKSEELLSVFSAFALRLYFLIIDQLLVDRKIFLAILTFV